MGVNGSIWALTLDVSRPRYGLDIGSEPATSSQQLLRFIALFVAFMDYCCLPEVLGGLKCHCVMVISKHRQINVVDNGIVWDVPVVNSYLPEAEILRR